MTIVTYNARNSRENNHRVIAPSPSRTCENIHAPRETNKPLLNDGGITKTKPQQPSSQMKRTKKKKYTQMYLDFGQKSARRCRCLTCGLLYMPGVIDDEKLHEEMHRKGENVDGSLGILCGRRFCKYECVDDDCGVGGGVYKVEGGGGKDWEVLMGFLGEKLGCFGGGGKGGLGFVWVGPEGVVGGVVVVERVCEGFVGKVLEEGAVVVEEKGFGMGMEIVMGVRMVWVDESLRRKGVGNMLVDIARRFLVYGFVVPREQVGFTAPTALGARFASSYCGRSDKSIIVYNNCSSSRNKK